MEKIQHSVPYVNPHPNNCVCPHVGYQAVFISPPPLTPPSTTATTTAATTATSSTSTTTAAAAGSSTSTTSGAGASGGDEDGPALSSESAAPSSDGPSAEEGSGEAETQLNRDTAEGPSLAESGTPSDSAPQPPPPSLVSSFSSSSCRSSSPSSPTSSSSVVELVERPQTKTTANLGSSSVEDVEPAAKDANSPSPSDSSPQSLASGESESRNTSPNQSQASDESSSIPEESRRGSKPLDFFPDNEINTAILGPSEIRKGLKECITEKNSALFKYSTTSILKKLKSKSEETNKSKTSDDAGEDDQEDKEQSDEAKKEDDQPEDNPPGEKEEPKEVEAAPEPYNPYVEYQLSNTDLPLVARLLRNVEPNLLWTWTRDSISFKHLSREQLVNRFPNTPFTTKVRLCDFFVCLSELKICTSTYLSTCLSVYICMYMYVYIYVCLSI